MENYHKILTWKLAKDAFSVASNVNRSTEDRWYCTKFLFRLNKDIIALNYEGTKFEMYFVIWSIILLIKDKYGTEKAYTELIRFYPDLDYTEIREAVESDLFVLT
jgi:hypothetical protein